MLKPRRLHLFALLALLMTAALLAPPLRAQVLDDRQREAVLDWFGKSEAERGDLDALGLPATMSQPVAEKSLAEIWGLYTSVVNDKELGDLPLSLAELAKKAEGGRVGLQAKSMTLGELKMPFAVIRREKKAPAQGGRALYICTHGGGANPKVDGPHAWTVNSREWQTQVTFAVRVYQPEGIYFVPRMADDRLGRWWHRHNHDAFERVIQQGIAHWGVDPNRVYLLGISEGGFGTDIVAPFMPDRFAGANAMASGVALSNPPENLRNLAFRTDVGEKDTTFNRVGLAKLFHNELDALRAADPDGYEHSINVQAGRGHGIDYRPGIVWVTKHTRNPWPSKLVWTGKKLHDRRRDRHYWIEIDGDVSTHAVRITAEVDAEANTIAITARQLEIEGDNGNPTHAKAGTVTKDDALSGVTLRVLLHDELLDLSQPVRIVVNGQPKHEGKVNRDATVQLRTLAEYGDPEMAASAAIDIDL